MHCCNVNLPEVLVWEKILEPNTQRILVVKKILFITFTIDKNDLAFVNAQLKTTTEPGEFEVMIGDKKARFNYSY